MSHSSCPRLPLCHFVGLNIETYIFVVAVVRGFYTCQGIVGQVDGSAEILVPQAVNDMEKTTIVVGLQTRWCLLHCARGTSSRALLLNQAPLLGRSDL